MATKTLQIPTQDGQADAFAAFPDDGAQHPGVLLYMDVFGLRPRLEEMARELAGHGYFVLVPHVYYRDGQAPLIDLPELIGDEDRPALFEQLMPFYVAHTTERALRDADAYLTFLTGRPEVAAGPVAAIGYCMGAVLAMRTAAAHSDRVAAVAGFHPGALTTEAPDSPHLLAPKVTAEVHFGVAEGDMTPEEFGGLNESLEAAGVRHTNEIYPGTVHGFTMADTSAFSPDGTQRHWDRLLPLLERTLTN
ncbi:dienelactone hydrolase family protein [Streptomyces sp. NBC_00572]|uniref:dienelactone hydrolase family protein n=1 Tax=Streptomyces sp. NBC_00572 TaxID=2903664 RepID=UPI002259FAE2|nr:dienelactone hydrolase family protein [Streptomyces sp. NBC_00572]MCX4982518.1 dienelactone hydrolase family protein [Streptomyces sp. NBC_00572]